MLQPMIMSLTIIKDLAFYSNRETTMKQDFIFANPPYSGSLHQTIFNKCIKVLKPDGQMTIIQPATTIQNKRAQTRGTPPKQMQNNLGKYYSEIIIEDGTVFKDALISTDLTITTIKMGKPTSSNIDKLTNKNGTVYTDVALEDISMCQMPPALFKSIRDKYEEYITVHGSLKDISVLDKLNPQKHYISIARIRGHRGPDGLKDDFYTHFAFANTKNKDNISLGLECVLSEEENIYSYLTTYVARFALALLKFNTDTQLRLVPLIKFSEMVTDEELFEMLNITDEEQDAIKEVIPYWNHYGKEY